MAYLEEKEMAQALTALLNSHSGILPAGTKVEKVELPAGRDRKKARQARTNPPGSIFITLRHGSAGANPVPAVAPTPEPHPSNETLLAELVRALRDAEQTPGHSFVALKWFRDAYLPQRGFSWAQDPDLRDRLLREVVDRRWVRVDRIPNPRNPEFPTAALRLNAGLPELREILGEAPVLGWDFQPISMRGEPMSETVRKMREQD